MMEGMNEGRYTETLLWGRIAGISLEIAAKSIPL